MHYYINKGGDGNVNQELVFDPGSSSYRPASGFQGVQCVKEWEVQKQAKGTILTSNFWPAIRLQVNYQTLKILIPLFVKRVKSIYFLLVLYW